MSDSDSWYVAKLGDLGGFSTSSVDKKIIAGQQMVNLANYMDVYNTNTIDSSLEFMKVSASGAEIVSSQVLPGDILFTPSSETPEDIGHSAVVAEKIENTLHSYHTVRFRPYNDSTFDLRFSAWFLNAESIQKQFYKKCSGSTRYTLTIPAFRSVICKIPKSNTIQREIAKYLDTIELAIEKTEALIEKYQNIKAGLMHDLFTRGITDEGKLRPPREEAPELYQETPIGWIPKDWVLTTCSNVCEKIIDCKNRTPPIIPDGYPVIRTPNVRHGEFVDVELVFTDYHSYLIWTARGKPQIGDIVITREAPVGEVCMIPERHQSACLGQRMMLYRTNSLKVEPYYFLFALQSEAIQNRLDLISGGSTVGHVRVGDIRDLWIFYPSSRSEQIKIGSSLKSISEKIENEKKQKTKLLMQKSGLMYDLLTGEVEVKVEEPEAVHAI